ncbi:hypothetical protein [Lampropedia puyangensis]|nr:hypothetical protein [Lampropedia puyangensis]
MQVHSGKQHVGVEVVLKQMGGGRIGYYGEQYNQGIFKQTG